jgi:hypothetical protein
VIVIKVLREPIVIAHLLSRIPIGIKQAIYRIDVDGCGALSAPVPGTASSRRCGHADAGQTADRSGGSWRS